MDLYKAGMRVEVVGHSDEFWNSYYGANVLRVDRTKLRVRYDQIVDEDYGEYTVEDVDLKHIRPYPPESFDINYRLTVGDDVEVYDRDGWWRGEVVFDELDDELMVYFSYMAGDDEEEFGTFPYDDVCIHQEVKQVGKGFEWSHVKVAGPKIMECNNDLIGDIPDHEMDDIDDGTQVFGSDTEDGYDDNSSDDLDSNTDSEQEIQTTVKRK
ncbi:hypothetical protein LXL04_029966 [Taraxacum kok-saghyz]